MTTQRNKILKIINLTYSYDYNFETFPLDFWRGLLRTYNAQQDKNLGIMLSWCDSVAFLIRIGLLLYADNYSKRFIPVTIEQWETRNNHKYITIGDTETGAIINKETAL